MYMYIFKGSDVKKYIDSDMGTKAMEDMQVVLKRFGDEQSTLLDRFERLSFEVQLNKAILSRSFSVPYEPRYQLASLTLPKPQEPEVIQGRRHHHQRRIGFQKILKKMFKPIFGNMKEEEKESIPDNKNFKFMKPFSRSMRV